MHTAATAPSWIQNTGAPINRSRTLPPPTPVTNAKKPAVTSVWRRRTAINAPVSAKTPIPARSASAMIEGRSAFIGAPYIA